MNKSKRSRLLLSVCFGFVSAVLLVAMWCLRLGYPLTIYACLFQTLWILCPAAIFTLEGKRRLVATLLFAVCLCLVLPGTFQVIPGIEKWSLFDDAGGRSGWEFAPGLRFGSDGPNTAILESYVGLLKPCWRYRAPHSPYIRDGNERVHSRNVIRQGYFPEILAMLPDDDARRSVIAALTDPENRLRVHQGLLLVCLRTLSYPEGFDDRSWWSQHRQLLHAEHDPVVAATVTHGWLKEIDALFPNGTPYAIMRQYRAAQYQQRGSWGGHFDFGESFLELELGERQPNVHAAELGQTVIWWPERQTQPAS